MGQLQSPARGWPKFTAKNLVRYVDVAAGTGQQSSLRSRPADPASGLLPGGGGLDATNEAQQNSAIAANAGWNARLDVVLLPPAFLKMAAAASNARKSTRVLTLGLAVMELTPSKRRIRYNHEDGGPIQVMPVQGLLARSVSDLRLSLPALAARDVRDPWWQPMPIPPQGKRKGVRVALLGELEGYEADPEVAAGLANAAKALGDAGYEVEDASPPHFMEIAELWSPLVMAESRLGFAQVIEKLGDPKVKKAMATWLEITPDLDLRTFSAGFGRRDQILREWRVFLQKYPILVTPPSWMKPFPVDFDQQGAETFRRILHAQSPMLAVALLGLPGLSVPTGIVGGVPTGVQIVADRFREDLCFDAGDAIEAALGRFTPIDPRAARKA